MPGAKYLMKLHAREIERQPYSESDKQTNIQNGRQTYSSTIKWKTACLPVLLYSQLFRFSFGHLENGCSSATGHICGLSVFWPLRLPFFIHSAFSCCLICTWKPALLWHIRVRSICTDCLIVRPLPADKRSCQLYLIQADGLGSPDRAMSTPTKPTEYFTCSCCFFPAGVGIVVIADVDAHVSLHSHLHFQQLSIVKNAPRRCLRCVELQFTYWHEECDMSCCYICLHYDKLIFPTSFCSSSSLSLPKYIFAVWRFLVSSAVWNLHKTLFFLPLQDAPKALNLHFDRSGQST